METQRSWRLEGGKFQRRRSDLSQEEALRQSLLDGNDSEKRKHVHFAEGTLSHHSSLRVLDVLDERPTESGWKGEYVKSIVYGGLDAIVTSFALVASVSGGNLTSGVVLVLGIANLIADGISMGFGDYLSTSAEQAHAANQKSVTDWEINSHLHEQMLNLVEEYEASGMERSDAEAVVAIFAKYKDQLSQQKLAIQDGIVPPDDDEDDTAWKNGLVTFASFIAFGCTPLLSFAILNPFTSDIHVKFAAACAVTALALILLGAAKAHVSGEKHSTSIVMVLINGGLAASAAYVISWGLGSWGADPT